MADRCGAPTKAGTPCRRTAGPSGRCGQHPDLDDGTIRFQVDRALADIPDNWQTAVARMLADELDGEEPNASMARELRAVMAQLTAETPAEADTADELRKRRADRQSRTAG